MTRLKLYAKKAPTTDATSIALGLTHKLDTLVYADPQCKILKARYRWDSSNCPRRGQKEAMLNCFKWDLVWIQPTPFITRAK